jgi:hypothetical protein
MMPMIWKCRAKVQEGKLVFSDPVPMPDGTQVEVQVVEVPPPEPPPTPEEIQDFLADPAHGMWADREDMKDSVAWLEQERAKWRRRRLTGQD